jgi:hypothetical protein
MTTKLVSAIAGVLGCLLLGAPAYAQATSTFTVQASGTVTTAPESVTFSGPIQILSTIVTDPAGGPPTAVVNIDARQLTARGASSGTVFLNSGQAHLTRPLVATDMIQTTFSFFPTGPGGFLKPRTAVATLNLSYNLATGALTAVTASISTPNFP